MVSNSRDEFHKPGRSLLVVPCTLFLPVVQNRSEVLICFSTTDLLSSAAGHPPPGVAGVKPEQQGLRPTPTEEQEVAVQDLVQEPEAPLPARTPTR